MIVLGHKLAFFQYAFQRIVQLEMHSILLFLVRGERIWLQDCAWYPSALAGSDQAVSESSLINFRQKSPESEFSAPLNTVKWLRP
jgi:hypothetical protein